jgi:NAD(P)-dependent dehydrogenase (short-subunit alcohol dehydrogenase family)
LLIRSNGARPPVRGRVRRPSEEVRREEVANVISFITSSQASYMTGCDILVDGGVVLLDPARIAADARMADGVS